MIIEAKQRGRCGRCAGFLEIGEEIEYFPPLPGVTESATFHVGECPTAKPARRAQNVRRDLDIESLLEARKCSQCGEVWTFMKGGARASTPTATCPSCGGGWLLVGQNRDHLGFEREGWAS